MADDCVFCRILAGELPASFVLREGRVAAFMDVQPVNPGHMLVIPVRHAETLAELDVDEAAEMMRAAQRVAGALRASGFRCEGVNLFLADGEAAGQEVFHTHVHIFPRWPGDGFGLRFGPDYGNLPPRAALDDAAEAIRAALE